MIQIRDLGSDELLAEFNCLQTKDEIYKWLDKNGYEYSMTLKENGILTMYVTDMFAEAEEV